MEEKKLAETNPKIKIVFLCRDFGKVNRGVEAHVKELSKELAAKFDVKVFSGTDADNFSKVVQGKFDLVIPTNGRMQALKMNLGRIFGGYKTLIAGHAGIGRDEVWNLLTRPDVYVALTDAELNWAKQFAFGVKLVKIPNGIDLEKFSPKGKKKDLGLKTPIVLSVGALEWYKHHDLAIRAVSKLPQTSLLIVGEGSEKEKLIRLGDQLLGKERFKILSVDYEEMPEIYRSADLFTLPSWDREAFGIVYLEAMASNLPVVAPNDLARKEIIGESGILTNVFDIQKYSQSLDRALTDNWKNKPREQAGKFSWEKIAGFYEELILKICR